MAFLIQTIKKQINEARKENDKERILILSTFYAEAAMVGKNKGNRDSTNEEVISIARKFIKNAEETCNQLSINDPRIDKLTKEIALLKEFLPALTSENDISEFVDQLISQGETNIGKIMGALKSKFGAAIDMKFANKLVRNKLGN